MWRVPLVSYHNKTHDADEIGLTWMNHLVHRVLLPIKSDEGVPIVLVGHSLGARLLSRALFSGSLLKEEPPDEEVDLFIGLQSAFSMNRSLPERRSGNEGAPYRDHARRSTRIALVWSRNDKATPKANWVTGANYAGGRPGYRRALCPGRHRPRTRGYREVPMQVRSHPPTMRRKTVRAMSLIKVLVVLVAVFALSFGVAYASGWTYEGCWSPYPNCVGAKDVYTDSQGNFWQCGACGTTTNPGPSTCYQSGDLNRIGYWCPAESS